MKHSTIRYLVGAGVAGLIGLGGVGLAHAQSDDTGTTDTLVDGATTDTAVDDSATTDTTDTADDTGDTDTTADDSATSGTAAPADRDAAGCEGGGRGAAATGSPAEDPATPTAETSVVEEGL